MRYVKAAVFVVMVSGSVAAQQYPRLPNVVSAGTTAPSVSTDLPVQRLGNDDLVGITVYDCPELTRTARVDSSGEIRLPMLHSHIKAAGLYPTDLEGAITKQLREEHVLVDPIVSVNVVEYRSRPISVVGAVRTPITFQATGSVTLLDAISQAGGLSENAGPEILVSRKAGDDRQASDTVQRIPVHSLIDAVDTSLNLELHGGEEVRIPEAERFYVLGNVHRPGAFPIKDGPESTVLKALALAEGLDHFTGSKAYVFRSGTGTSEKHEVEIELKKIIGRKAPDVSLQANDILYIPTATGKKAALTALDRAIMVGSSLGTTLLYVNH